MFEVWRTETKVAELKVKTTHDVSALRRRLS